MVVLKPLFYGISLTIILLIISKCSKCCKKEKKKQDLTNSQSQNSSTSNSYLPVNRDDKIIQFYIALIIFIYFLQPHIVLASFEMFNCQNLSDNNNKQLYLV